MLDIQTLKIKITHYYPAHPDVEKQSGWVAAISPQGLAHTGHCLNLLADYWEDGGIIAIIIIIIVTIITIIIIITIILIIILAY